jgi:PAS domain-containing protein
MFVQGPLASSRRRDDVRPTMRCFPGNGIDDGSCRDQPGGGLRRPHDATFEWNSIVGTWVRAHLNGVEGEEEAVSGVDGHEFGDRRMAASHLSPSELLDRFPARLLMERLSIPMIAVNVAGDIMIANDAFAELSEVLRKLSCR